MDSDSIKNTPASPNARAGPPPLNMATHPTRGHLSQPSSPLKMQQDAQPEGPFQPPYIPKRRSAATNLGSPFKQPALFTTVKTPTVVSPFTRPASDVATENVPFHRLAISSSPGPFKPAKLGQIKTSFSDPEISPVVSPFTRPASDVATENVPFHRLAISSSPGPFKPTKLGQIKTYFSDPEISPSNLSRAASPTKVLANDAAPRPPSSTGTTLSNEIPVSPPAKAEPRAGNPTSPQKVDPEARVKQDNLALAIAMKEVEEAEVRLACVHERLDAKPKNQKTTFSSDDISLFTTEQEYIRAKEVLGFVREHYNQQYPATPSILSSPLSGVQPLASSKITVTPPSTPKKFNSQTTPSTKRSHNPVQGLSGALDITPPASPYPNSKHYSVVVGRRVGVYTSWNQVKPLVEGLGRKASYQSFATHKEALADYVQARKKGWVTVFRLPNDSVTIFGSPDDAEDL